MAQVPVGPCLGFYVLDPAVRARLDAAAAWNVNKADSSSDNKKKRSREKLYEKVEEDEEEEDVDDPEKAYEPSAKKSYLHSSFLMKGGRLDFSAIRLCAEKARERSWRRTKSKNPGKFASMHPPPPSSSSRHHGRQNTINNYFEGLVAGGNSDHLLAEKRSRNLVDREEGVAVQYLSLGGYRRYIVGAAIETAQVEHAGPQELAALRAAANRCPNLVASGLHAGPGQLTFGWSRQQRADLTLIYYDDDDDDEEEGRSRKASRVFVHNHHGSFWHYSGHSPHCAQSALSQAGTSSAPSFATPYEGKTASQRADDFRTGLAQQLTRVDPSRVCFYYSVTTSCDLFHGTDRAANVPGPDPTSQRVYATATTALLAEKESQFMQSMSEKKLSVSKVKEDIRAGKITGFVTVRGGSESPAMRKIDPAGSRFGFCAQNYAPTPTQVGEYTRRQIKDMADLADQSDQSVDAFIKAQMPRTLVSGTFHSEETVSTNYLRWLMVQRQFDNFEITHLMVYRFCNYPRDFLEPILQKRHECKQQGNKVAAECLKLIGNGSFGYNGLEASNYSRVRLMTQPNLERRRKALNDMCALTLDRVTMLGLVKVKVKRPRREMMHLHQRQRANDGAYFLDVAAVDDDDDDNDGDDSEVDEERERERVLGVEAAEGDDDDDDDDDDAYRWEFQPLYAVEVSGNSRQLFNNLPKAVAVLSNSKRLFFSHLDIMFRCLDPRLAELCYVDTDSCIWSFTYSRLEDCILPERRALWQRSNIVADEEGPISCHGKMKLEGTHAGGLFKTSKIYRLFSSPSASAGDFNERYTRCKGVNRWIANRLDDDLFSTDNRDSVVVHRTCLRPARTGEIQLNHESRSLSIPYNLKRKVVGEKGIHSFAFSEHV